MCKKLVVFAVMLVVSVLGASGDIITPRDSADFNVKTFEGDVVPTPLSGSLAGWAATNGYYNILQTGITGYTGPADASLSFATGWTVEMRFKVLASGVNDSAALEFLFGDGTYYNGLKLYADRFSSVVGGVTNFVNFSDSFHTLRAAMDANGADRKLYLDGVDLGISVPDGANVSRLWIGDTGSNVQGGGHIQVDYLRWDTTGGYAAIPEPATLSLLGLAAAAVLLLRRVRF